MKKPRVLVIVLLPALILFGCAPLATRLHLPNPGYSVEDNANRAPDPIREDPTLSYRISLRAQFSILRNPDHEDLIVTLPIPPDTPTQTVASWEASPSPFREVVSKYGYRFQEFNLGKWGQPALDYTAEVDLHKVRYEIDPATVGTLRDVPEQIAKDYTVDGPFYHLRSPTILNALSFAAGNEQDILEAVRRIWGYTRHSLYYKLGHKVAADETLRRGYGSCTGFSFSMIALCRAAGIPARYTSGTFSPPLDKNRGQDRYFHKIIEVYYPKIGWVPVESTRGKELPESEQAQKYFDARDNRLFSVIYEPEPSLVRTDPRLNTVSYHASGPGHMVVNMSVVGYWIKERL